MKASVFFNNGNRTFGKTFFKFNFCKSIKAIKWRFLVLNKIKTYVLPALRMPPI